MAVDIAAIREARKRIAPYVLHTPLLRMPGLDSWLGCEVYVKPECMQITHSFKLRGATNKLLSIDAETRKKGVVGASSGNHGRGLAYAAAKLGVPATIVIPYGAPQVKINAVKTLGAEVVRADATERFDVARKIAAETGAVMAHPYDDEMVIAGQGTAGLEIAEDLPDVDVVITGISGGGLLGGLATALKGSCQHVRVYGAEPAVMPRYSESLKAGKRVVVPFHASIADALLTQTPGEKNFPLVQKNVDAVYPVSETDILRGMKLLLMEGKLLAEPGGCIGIGALLSGQVKVKPKEKVCILISGGNLDFSTLQKLEDVKI
jgi:threonine dehydratase